MCPGCRASPLGSQMEGTGEHPVPWLSFLCDNRSAHQGWVAGFEQTRSPPCVTAELNSPEDSEMTPTSMKRLGTSPQPTGHNLCLKSRANFPNPAFPETLLLAPRPAHSLLSLSSLLPELTPSPGTFLHIPPNPAYPELTLETCCN